MSGLNWPHLKAEVAGLRNWDVIACELKVASSRMCIDTCGRKLNHEIFSSNTPTFNKAATTKFYVVAACYYYPIEKPMGYYPSFP
jgi:hypothetical protein